MTEGLVLSQWFCHSSKTISPFPWTYEFVFLSGLEDRLLSLGLLPSYGSSLHRPVTIGICHVHVIQKAVIVIKLVRQVRSHSSCILSSHRCVAPGALPPHRLSIHHW